MSRVKHMFAALLITASAGAPTALRAELPAATYPGATWEKRAPAELGMDAEKIGVAQTYARSRFGAGIVVRNGYEVASWGNTTDRFPVYSVTKGIGALLLGIAVTKPEIGIRLDDKAQALYPAFGTPPANNDPDRVAAITIEQLATHSAGFEKDRFNPDIEAVPGTAWQYSDGGANWLADILTYKLNEDLRAVLKREVLDHLGITLRTGTGEVGDLTWRDIEDNVRGTTIGAIPRREFNAGISANVNALARIGLLLERRGNWNGTQILRPDFVEQLSRPAGSTAGLPVIDGNGRPDPMYPDASAHHGLYWFNNGDGTLPDVPRDAFWAWGLGDHLIVVIPSLQLVIARTSAKADAGELRQEPFAWKEACQENMCAHYDALAPFLNPLVQAVANAAPLVSAGADVTLTAPTLDVELTGTVSDDGRPSQLVTSWSMASGEGTIAAPNALTTRVTFPGPGTYTLRLTATDGELASSDEVNVTVNAPAPTLSFTSSAASVVSGSTVTLTWNASNASACTASNGWNGAKAASGSESVTVSANTTYALECTGPGGAAQSAVSVTATPAPPPPSGGNGGGGGGGGGTVQWWMLAGLLLSALRGFTLGASRRERLVN